MLISGHRYSPLIDFLRINGVPRGPVFLKDWGRHTLYRWREHGSHKLASIREIITAFTRLPFILIGDSGEQDPEIYLEVVREFPGRIDSIYIRSVSAGPVRRAEIAGIADDVRAAGSSLLLVADSEMVANNEARAGRIDRDRLQYVRLDEAAEKALPSPAGVPPLATSK